MGWSDAYDAHADLWRTTLVLGGFHETGLARVPRSGQRRYWHCSERRSIWRETPRCEAVEGSGFWSNGGSRGSRRKYVPRGLYGSFSLCRVCAALFSEKVTQGRSDTQTGCGTRFTTSETDRKSTRLNSSHLGISYAVFCLKKK